MIVAIPASALSNLLIVEEEQDHNSPAGPLEEAAVGHQLDIPLRFDSTFNLLVCSECNVAIPCDWSTAHLRDNHGISKRLDEILEILVIEEPCLSSIEVKEWLDTTWVLHKPVTHIPMMNGYRCSRCNYCCPGEKVMRQHFKVQHKGESWREHHEECIVQQPFKGQLSKYLQVDRIDGSGIPNDIPTWKADLSEEFWETVEHRTQLHEKEEDNPRVLSAFIAKSKLFHCNLADIRWHLVVTDVDKAKLFKIAAMPTIKDPHHRIILSARRYIQRCSELLYNGNMMVRRKLMTYGYIAIPEVELMC